MTEHIETEAYDSLKKIRSKAAPACLLCGAEGALLYVGLKDQLFEASGNWTLKRCVDVKCGLTWMDPMPLEVDIWKAYEQYFTHERPAASYPPATSPRRRRIADCCRAAYQACRFGCGEGTGKCVRWLLALPILLSRIECDSLDIPLRYLAITAKGRMLDVGCGDGRHLNMSETLGWKAEGVELDPGAVASTRQKGLTVHHGELTDQHYPDETFDLVLLSHVIEHLCDPIRTIAEIYRILRPGGKMVVTTPNIESWGHRYFTSSWVALDPPRHLYLFNHRNLPLLANKAGFSQSAVFGTLNTTPFNFIQSRRISREGRGDLSRPPNRREIMYGRAASAIEILARAWSPRTADELLLEAHK
jgi:SAM-dependent methyltransferase